MSHTINRRHYAEMFGPTTGDRIRLGDTDLWLEVEKDLTHYGDECKFGGGKVIREGMGQAAGVGSLDALDCVITNALIVAPQASTKRMWASSEASSLPSGRPATPTSWPGSPRVSWSV